MPAPDPGVVNRRSLPHAQLMLYLMYLSEKPCLGCNGLSRITGLEEIVMCYKPLAGRLIWRYEPSQAVIRLVMACKELPRVETQHRIKNSTSSFQTIFWIFRIFIFSSHFFSQISGDPSLSSGAQTRARIYFRVTPARSYSKNRTLVVFLSKHLSCALLIFNLF
jgi:hypothetical protein